MEWRRATATVGRKTTTRLRIPCSRIYFVACMPPNQSKYSEKPYTIEPIIKSDKTQQIAYVCPSHGTVPKFLTGRRTWYQSTLIKQACRWMSSNDHIARCIRSPVRPWQLRLIFQRNIDDSGSFFLFTGFEQSLAAWSAAASIPSLQQL